MRPFFLAAVFSMLVAVPIQTAHGQSRPNIIVILVDDMGFSDIGCYGGEIPTPNIDKLAAGGLRFTQFYNTARCCPTRAALLTGLYSHEAGIGHMTEDDELPGYRGRLNDQCVTFADVARSAGYFTLMTGKWHVGQNFGVVPWERGFDRSLNSPAGGFYYGADKIAKLYLNGKLLANDDPILPNGWYTTDLWTDFGIKFIDEAIGAKKPFLLYLAHNAPHFPLEAPQDEIARFRGKYKMGWDKLREQRNASQINLGVVDKAWALSPRPKEVSAWEMLTAEQQDHFDHIMAIYAAVVAHLDASIGRLTEALKQRGVLDDTLILFMSDNGANAESGPMGKLLGDPPGSPRSEVFEGQSWATLSNTPLRRYKHFNHEGGIATPLIAHWPKGIAGKGELRSQPGHVIDIMPTIVELTGATYPKEFKGKPILSMEGRSLIPALSDKPIEREALFWEHEGNAAIRVADWKLVRLGRKGPWELYNLKTDRTELHDLAAQQPDRAREMAATWEAWAVRTHVKPYPEPKGSAPRANAANAGEADATPLDIADIFIRDPFILTDSENGRYILVAKIHRKGEMGWECFTSKDLRHWQSPVTVFTPPQGFWADRDFWAPEIHAYLGKYYLLGTVSSESAKRGTQIFVADRPLGPYRPHSDGAATPHDWMALDGTLHVENGHPWMVFCHEWLQVDDGTMNAVRLADDLSKAVGEPIQLFRASQAPWCRPIKPGKYVTDGPWVYRMSNGKLLLLWSSFSDKGYAVGIARSESGTIEGPWEQDPKPLFEGGGHCMIFHSLDGKPMLLLHASGKSGTERARFFEVHEESDSLRLDPVAWPLEK